MTLAGGNPAGTDTGGAVLVGGTQCPQPAATQKFFSQEIASMREIFKSQFLKVEVFLPFFFGWSGSSSLAAWNRKASTLWRGGALWGKLRARCDQARGLGPGRGHHHHRKLSAQHGRGGHAWEREGGELLMHRRGLGLARGVPHLKNLLVRELEGAASVGDSRTTSKRKKNQILGESEKFSSLNETKSLSKKSTFGCEEKLKYLVLQE